MIPALWHPRWLPPTRHVTSPKGSICRLTVVARRRPPKVLSPPTNTPSPWGVTTSELEISLSKDGKPMIWHDMTIQKKKCRDTAPAFPNDPAYPYVGKFITELTFQQLRTVRCDKFQEEYKDTLHRVPGATIYTLDELFTMVNKKATYPVYFNIETKVVPVKESDAKAYRTMKTIVDTARRHKVLNRVMLQSFDWRTLAMVRKYAPSVPTVMLFGRIHWGLLPR
ncbi:MAG: glycerophosphodiester phosphodiesterase family protein [Lawsonella clevelandensis]